MDSGQQAADAMASRPPAAIGRWPAPMLRMIAVATISLAGFVVVLIIVAGLRQPPAIDLAVLHALQRRRTGTLTAFFRFVTTVGSPVGLAITMAVVATGLALRRKSWRPVIVGAVSLVGAELLGSVLKVLVGRARPELADRVPNVSAIGLDFPSGHSTQSAAAYLTIALLVARPLAHRIRRIAVYLAAAVGIGLVGLSRLYLGVHWFTDVLASWLLGVAWVLIVWVAVALLFRPKADLPESIQ